MAPLIVAGRRYLVSSDDVAPGLGLAVLLRALWIIALVWVLRGLIRSVGDCRDIWLFWLYLWLSLAVYVGALLLQIAALRVSLRGTLVQPQKRAFVGKAFVSLALLSAAQLLLAIFGLVLAVGQAPVCAKEVEEAISRSENGVEPRILFLIAIATQLVDFAIFVALALVLRQKPSLRSLELGSTNMLEQEMEERCRSCLRITSCVTCNLFGGGREGDFRMAGRLLATLFSNTTMDPGLDLTPSDVMAGLILLRYEHRALEERDVEEHGALRGAELDMAGTEESMEEGGLQVAAARASRSTATMQGYAIEEDLLTTHNRASRVRGKRLLRRGNDAAVGDLRDLIHNSRFLLAPYSWMLLVYSNPLSGWLKILNECCGLPPENCPGQARRDPQAAPAHRDLEMGLHGATDNALLDRSAEGNPEMPLLTGHRRIGRVDGDNWMRAHTGAFLSMARIRSESLIYASFRNDTVGQSPYAIVKDEEKQQIVLCIRGTLSLEDLLIDIAAEPCSLEDLGVECGFDGRQAYAHTGIVSVADWIRKDLARHGLLDAALSTNRGWGLTIVGHSLGAGAAALLGLMLKQQYASLRILCYSPPGALLSLRLAEEMEDYCLSFVLASDLVPRLSPATLTQLRNEVLDVISRAKVTKAHILRSILSSSKGAVQQVDEMLYPPGHAPESEFLLQLNVYREFLRREGEDRLRDGLGAGRSLDTRDADVLQDMEYPGARAAPFRAAPHALGHTSIASFLTAGPMAIPGRIVHLVKTKDSPNVQCCGVTLSNHRAYTPVYASRGDFNRLNVSPSMGIDHFPDRVVRELEAVGQHWGMC